MVLVFADGRYTERINAGCLLMGQSVFMIEVSKEVKGEHPLQILQEFLEECMMVSSTVDLVRKL